MLRPHEHWKAHDKVEQLKPKKRAILIPIPNKKMFVLGFEKKERHIVIAGFDVTYESMEEYNLRVIYHKFKQYQDSFDMFAFIGFAPDSALKRVSVTEKENISLPPHLLKDWKRVMGDNTSLPHYSYFCLPQSKIDVLNKDVIEKWRELCPELRAMIDERNMILV